LSRIGDWLRGSDIELKALSATPTVVDALGAGAWSPYPVIGGTNLDTRQMRDAYATTQSAGYGYLYSHQPAVRTVVDYVARNVAQLGLHLFERVSDTERERRGDHPAAVTMRRPNPFTPGGQWVQSFVAVFLVYDNAYALKLRQGRGPLTLLGLPPHMVGVIGDNRFSVDAYRIWRADGTFFDVDPADIVHWRGYNPDDPRLGVSRLETLRKVLIEEAVSQAASTELAKSGLLSGYIKRPLDAPDWSDQARTRFEEDWANRMRQSTKRNPVLEEGMEFVEAGMSPKDAEMLEGRKFTLETVARLYGLATVPAADEEGRRQFYADVLPPITESLAAVLDLTLLEGEFGTSDHYFEFNLDEKLRGNVEEKLSTMVSVSGAPFMTRNEVRAMQNLPALEGGDELITPLNVLVGSKPSVREMPPQDPNGPEQDGSFRQASLPQGKALELDRRAKQRRRRDQYAADLRALLARHFSRQENATKSKKVGVKALDDPKWDRELADDLYTALKGLLEREGGIAAARLGLADFDFDRVKAYLEAAAAARAHAINAATQRELEDNTYKDVFEHAKTVRAEQGGVALATQMAAFAAREAAKQAPDAQQRTKTWVVTSSKSRHPELDGETVPLYSAFSNGMQYPGDGDVDDSAGCQCVLEIS
jgi:HK97 family phage portal protein